MPRTCLTLPHLALPCLALLCTFLSASRLPCAFRALQLLPSSHGTPVDRRDPSVGADTGTDIGSPFSSSSFLFTPDTSFTSAPRTHSSFRLLPNTTIRPPPCPPALGTSPSFVPISAARRPVFSRLLSLSLSLSLRLSSGSRLLSLVTETLSMPLIFLADILHRCSHNERPDPPRRKVGRDVAPPLQTINASPEFSPGRLSFIVHSSPFRLTRRHPRHLHRLRASDTSSQVEHLSKISASCLARLLRRRHRTC